MSRPRARYVADWFAALAGLASILVFALGAAACVTALVVSVVQPPTAVWIALWVVLTVVLALLWLRTNAREWYDWFLRRR